MLPCPVCERQVPFILKWRTLYICTPCSKKYEKIEHLIKSGQLLSGRKLEAILKQFGPKEIEEIEKASNVSIDKTKKRGRKKVDKNAIIGIKPPGRKKKKL